jgi:hypothetical protein
MRIRSSCLISCSFSESGVSLAAAAFSDKRMFRKYFVLLLIAIRAIEKQS